MSRIRLLTANLWSGRADASALAAVISKHDPDLVLTQELTIEHARVIERLMPYGLMLPNPLGGLGLALRKPARVIRIALPQRDALAVRLEPETVGGRSTPIEVINVHMSAPTRPYRFYLRHRQLQLLSEHMTRTEMPRALAGDLNTLTLMRAYRKLRLVLKDAALEHSPNALPTWSPGANWPRLLRIDHVLVDRLRVLDFEVIRIAGSDHSALIATLSLEATSDSARAQLASVETKSSVPCNRHAAPIT